MPVHLPRPFHIAHSDSAGQQTSQPSDPSKMRSPSLFIYIIYIITYVFTRHTFLDLSWSLLIRLPTELEPMNPEFNLALSRASGSWILGILGILGILVRDGKYPKPTWINWTLDGKSITSGGACLLWWSNVYISTLHLYFAYSPLPLCIIAFIAEKKYPGIV